MGRPIMERRRYLGFSCLWFVFLFAVQASAQSYNFDFQPSRGPLEPGFTVVTNQTLYPGAGGYGFLVAPQAATDGSNKTWPIFGRTVTIEEAVPASVLSDATRDCVTNARNMTFKADVVPGQYDVTLWIGDVTAPRHQMRATVNGAIVDVERIDINIGRGNLWIDPAANGPDFMGSSVPRTVRVDASSGLIEITLGSHPDGASPIEWTFYVDEDPKNPPAWKTETIVPAFSAASLQAVTIHPAAEAPLVKIGADLTIGSAPSDPLLQKALDYFNSGAIGDAVEVFRLLSGDSLRSASAAGLLWCAGHPAIYEGERSLLLEAEALLEDVLTGDPQDWAAQDLLTIVKVCDDAHRYRELYGHGDWNTVENMGRSCSLVEQFQADHPYYWKGRILYLRNRGGLDPRRVTVSWERAEWMAKQMDPMWGAVNPHVHLYATDEWVNDGKPWTFIDWGELAGDGPEWARSLVSSINTWIDLFEWWAINRQSEEGDIGGGWTDDVEIVPAFGLMSFVLGGASDITAYSVVKFADGIWNSDIVDSDRGYQRQYADVEHTAEPTGNMLHIHLLSRFGDPEAVERIIKSAHTFVNTFLTDGTGLPSGHRHFKGNYMSSTQIANNANHRADIPLCGRVTTPYPYLVWYSGNPGIEVPLKAWTESWIEDAAKTTNRKPAGVFPQMVWTPTDGIGAPTNNDWWSNYFSTYGAGAFPSYQYYLYNLAGFFYLRTGEAHFREPLDALQAYAMAWHNARRPNLGNTPPVGNEGQWCGSKLQGSGAGAVLNVAVGKGSTDWDSYLAQFGAAYAKYLQNPTDDTTIFGLDSKPQELAAKWPYKTTEGLMTDRILLPGWADVISYYIGSEVFSTFFGMPVHAVTWAGTSRLFAAAIYQATQTSIGVSTYLFSDQPRTATIHLWQLEMNQDYILQAGPASGLGLPPSSIDQTIPFTLTRRGQGVDFNLPGRQTYGITITQVPSPARGKRLDDVPALVPDLGVAPADISHNSGAGELTVRIHNIGAADASSILVRAYEGVDDSGSLIGERTITSLEAPIDLVPRWTDLVLSFSPAATPTQVTVVIDPADVIAEVTEVNNNTTAYVGGAAPDLPPPFLTGIDPGTVKIGKTTTLTGRNIQPGVYALVSEAATTLITAEYVDAETITLTVGLSVPEGDYIVSVANPDGKHSNLMPLSVVLETIANEGWQAYR